MFYRPSDTDESRRALKPTVAIVHYAAPPGIGGVEVTMLHHARTLAAAGYPVRMIAGSGQGAIPGVEWYIDPLFGSRGTAIEGVNQRLAAGSADDAFTALVERTEAALRTALAGVDVAMVHNVLSLHKNLAFTAALRRLHDTGRGPRLLAWCHDFAWHDPLYQPELHSGWPWDLLREAWPNVTYVVVSADRRESLARLLGIPAQEIAVVTPGVDLAGLYKLEADTIALLQRHDLLAANPLLLLPARITRRKNIEQAIAIVGALRAEGMQPQLIVTGPPGPHNPTNAAYLEQLEALRHESGADDAIFFLYRVYTDDQGASRPVSDAILADLYRLSDGLLFPSRSEGFGIPMIEAALAALPIFCSDIPPFREIAGDAASYFDPQGDPHDIARSIARYYHDTKAYHLRRHVRRTATWDAIYKNTIAPLIAGQSPTTLPS